VTVLGVFAVLQRNYSQPHRVFRGNPGPARKKTARSWLFRRCFPLIFSETRKPRLQKSSPADYH
jgi:hypothetical protein